MFVPSEPTKPTSVVELPSTHCGSPGSPCRSHAPRISPEVSLSRLPSSALTFLLSHHSLCPHLPWPPSSAPPSGPCLLRPARTSHPVPIGLLVLSPRLFRVVRTFPLRLPGHNFSRLPPSLDLCSPAWLLVWPEPTPRGTRFCRDRQFLYFDMTFSTNERG